MAGGVAPYAISKAGVVQMTKSLALEWARHRIRVNALAPGYIETELNDAFFASDAGKALIRRIPQRRLGEARELDGPLLSAGVRRRFLHDRQRHRGRWRPSRQRTLDSDHCATGHQEEMMDQQHRGPPVRDRAGSPSRQFRSAFAGQFSAPQPWPRSATRPR